MQLPVWVLVIHIMSLNPGNVRNTEQIEVWPNNFTTEQACHQVAAREVQKILVEDLESGSATIIKTHCARQVMEPMPVPLI